MELPKTVKGQLYVKRVRFFHEFGVWPGGEKMNTHCGTDEGHKPKLMPLEGGEAHREFDLCIATKLRFKFFLRARHQGKPTANESNTNIRSKRAVTDKYSAAMCSLCLSLPSSMLQTIKYPWPFLSLPNPPSGKPPVKTLLIVTTCLQTDNQNL